MINRLRTIILFALTMAILCCAVVGTTYAQNAESKESSFDIKSAFYGRWVDAKDPNHLLEIYKEGALIIVQRRTEINDGSTSNRYTVISENGNKIKVDLGSGLTPLTITDDGSKISFLGDEYVKK